MSDYPSNVEVHRWAEAQPWGHKVPKNGMGRELIAAWNRAHPGRLYVKAQAFHGTLGGYNSHHCRCDACTSASTNYHTENDRGRRDEAMA